MVERLFKKYFEESKNVGVLSTLIETAVEAGLDKEKVITILFLENPENLY